MADNEDRREKSPGKADAHDNQQSVATSPASRPQQKRTLDDIPDAEQQKQHKRQFQQFPDSTLDAYTSIGAKDEALQYHGMRNSRGSNLNIDADLSQIPQLKAAVDVLKQHPSSAELTPAQRRRKLDDASKEKTDQPLARRGVAITLSTLIDAKTTDGQHTMYIDEYGGYTLRSRAVAPDSSAEATPAQQSRRFDDSQVGKSYEERLHGGVAITLSTLIDARTTEHHPVMYVEEDGVYHTQKLRSGAAVPASSATRSDGGGEEASQYKYSAMLFPDGNVGSDMIERLLRYVEKTSKAAYQQSSWGWSEAGKRAEMTDKDMRYIVLLRQHENETEAEFEARIKADDWGEEHPKIGGFCSFMVTKEAGQLVVYIYEIHLHPTMQGRKVGPLLLSLVEQIGRGLGLPKTMLTVFKVNERAIGMYRRCGYVEDEESPKPRKLRNGRVREYDYMIMSKDLRGAKKSVEETEQVGRESK